MHNSRIVLRAAVAVALATALGAFAGEHIYIWPDGKMPNAQPHQIAASTEDARAKGFKADEWRRPYIEWCEAPAKPNGCCMILISGGGYNCYCDVGLIRMWNKKFTEQGFQCVTFVYRTPRPKGLPIHQSAWEDGQRAVRLVRTQAAKRGYDPEK